MSCVFITVAVTNQDAVVDVSNVRVGKGRWAHVQATLKQVQNGSEVVILTGNLTYGKPNSRPDGIDALEFSTLEKPPLPEGWKDGKPAGESTKDWTEGFVAPATFKSSTTGKNMNHHVKKYIHQSEVVSGLDGIDSNAMRLFSCQFSDTRPVNDAKSLAFFCDLVTPPLLNKTKLFDWENIRPWFPTMHILIDFRCTNQSTTEYVVIKAGTGLLSGGKSETESFVYDARGKCLALSRQTTLVVPFSKNIRKSRL